MSMSVMGALESALIEARDLDPSVQAETEASQNFLQLVQDALSNLPENKAADDFTRGANESLDLVATQARAAELHRMGLFAARAATQCPATDATVNPASKN